MKKILLVVGLILFMAACTGAKSSEAEVQTRVAQLLTSFPTPSVLPVQKSPFPILPTAMAKATATLAQPTPEQTTAIILPTDTSAVAVATGTTGPTGTTQPTLGATPTITATFPTGDPRTSLGTPNWTDSMTSGGNWPTAADEFSTIAFNNGDMVFTALQNFYAWRLASTPSLTNFYLEMTGKFDACANNDSYGMMLRVPVLSEANRGYFFGITCTGSYFFKIWDGTVAPKGQMTDVIAMKTSSAIQTGANQVNRIGVLAKGSNFKFYINGIMIHEISDTTYSQGFFGVFIKKDVTDKLTVRISEISYWIVQ